MSIKTVRFNKKEEALLKKVLTYYGTDFSSCIKELLMEKLEDLRDLKAIKGLSEGRKSDYVTAKELNRFFK